MRGLIYTRFARRDYVAPIAQSEKIREAINWRLDYLFDAWRDLEETAKAWPEMDRYERNDFAAEWALPRMRLSQLQRLAPEMSLAQQERYQKLLELIERIQPTLDRIFAA